jgi:hypothetical protein
MGIVFNEIYNTTVEVRHSQPRESDRLIKQILNQHFGIVEAAPYCYYVWGWIRNFAIPTNRLQNKEGRESTEVWVKDISEVFWSGTALFGNSASNLIMILYILIRAENNDESSLTHGCFCNITSVFNDENI